MLLFVPVWQKLRHFQIPPKKNFRPDSFIFRDDNGRVRTHKMRRESGPSRAWHVQSLKTMLINNLAYIALRSH